VKYKAEKQTVVIFMAAFNNFSSQYW